MISDLQELYCYYICLSLSEISLSHAQEDLASGREQDQVLQIILNGNLKRNTILEEL